MREVVCQMVLAEIRPLVAAQIAQAKGMNYLVVREAPTGKFLRVAGPNERIKRDEEARNGPALQNAAILTLDGLPAGF